VPPESHDAPCQSAAAIGPVSNVLVARADRCPSDACHSADQVYRANGRSAGPPYGISEQLSEETLPESQWSGGDDDAVAVAPVADTVIR
jgi:hypothetical protein